MSKDTSGSAERAIIWKVHCPSDGPQLLRFTGLHVNLRAGQDEHVVTYFCPTCGQQRFQLVDGKVSRMLIDELKVAWSVVKVPQEALEKHSGAPITEAEVQAAVKAMSSPMWMPRLA